MIAIDTTIHKRSNNLDVISYRSHVQVRPSNISITIPVYIWNHSCKFEGNLSNKVCVFPATSIKS